MGKKESQQENKNFGYYMARYGNYLILASIVFVLVFAIVVIAVMSGKVENVEPVDSPAVITFQSPVMNGQISVGYSDTELQYNSALNIWQVHKGVDYVAEIGTNVLAAYDGTVTSVTTDILRGTVVEIDHGNNLKTTYGSLDSKTAVKVGDKVLKGDIIGKASNSATGETINDGEVHFEVWKDGNLVDPANYLDVSNGK